MTKQAPRRPRPTHPDRLGNRPRSGALGHRNGERAAGGRRLGRRTRRPPVLPMTVVVPTGRRHDSRSRCSRRVDAGHRVERRRRLGRPLRRDDPRRLRANGRPGGRHQRRPARHLHRGPGDRTGRDPHGGTQAQALLRQRRTPPSGGGRRRGSSPSRPDAAFGRDRDRRHGHRHRAAGRSAGATAQPVPTEDVGGRPRSLPSRRSMAIGLFGTPMRSALIQNGNGEPGVGEAVAERIVPPASAWSCPRTRRRSVARRRRSSRSAPPSPRRSGPRPPSASGRWPSHRYHRGSRT